MKMPARLAVFAAVAFTIHAAQTVWLTRTQPDLTAALALRQLNGSDADATALRWFDAEKNTVSTIASLALGSVWFAVFWTPLRQLWTWKKSLRFTLPLLAAATLLGGCVKPYDTPEFATIDTAETGFLIPLEGNSQQQDKFQSEEYLRQLKVAAKRVQLPHRWVQTGRLSHHGEWLATMRLIKVQRSPVTREWTADSSTGTSAKNQAIWIESADSVAFSLGFACTAFIPEEQAARFLYWYPSGTLNDVMDKEIRARIQQVAAEVAARYPLDALRAKKQEIMDAVRADATGFFAERGIVLTTIAMFGGMTYENPEIQRAIDKTFIAQQEKVVNQARFEAQQRENDRVELEANATAEKARRIAQGEADARKIAAIADAGAIREVNKALAEAQQNPLVLQFKQLEVEKVRAERWSGTYPQYFVAPSDKAALLLHLPELK